MKGKKKKGELISIQKKTKNIIIEGDLKSHLKIKKTLPVSVQLSVSVSVLSLSFVVAVVIAAVVVTAVDESPSSQRPKP